MTDITFFGTQQFAASILEAIVLSKQYNILAVITQPDRPVGRNQNIVKSAVKLLAEKHELKILQPESLKNNSEITNLKSEINIVCQYGLIIPKNIVEAPTRGTINVHTSLLPKYRGASPIQTALINGETKTGITIMLMDEKMDNGPILSQEKVIINLDDTYEVLSKKMEPIAAKLLLNTIPKYFAGEIKHQAQNTNEITFCKIFTRNDGKINWSKPASEIYNLYRGLTPWPGVWTTWNGKRLKLLKINKTINQKNKKTIEQLNNNFGTVTIIENKIFVMCGYDLVEIIMLQLEGKNIMDAKTFINGYKNFNGSVLG